MSSSNHLFNPFQVQKFFAQNIITSKLQPGGKREVWSNVVYGTVYVIIFLHSLVVNDNRTGELRYNFISQMRFCMQLYFASVLFIQISATTTIFRKEYVNSYHALINHTRELRKLNIQTHFSTVPTILMYTFIFVSVIPMFIYDVVTFNDVYSFTFFICQYLPSLAASVYIVTICSLMRICMSKFVSINAFLDGIGKKEQSCMEKFRTNQKNERPDLLMEICDGEYTVYQKLFIIHDDVAETARTINKMSGYDMCHYMIIVTINILSFMYDLFMDVVKYAKSQDAPKRTIYAPEYWSFMMLLGTGALISASTGLMDNANDTKNYLHQLRNLYPELNEQVELFSLQLIHSELKITAGNFFTIHRGILYKLLSAWITYIIIFMQLDTDISTVDAED